MRPLLLLALASAAIAQPGFEVATVKMVVDYDPQTMTEKIVANPGTLSMKAVRLRAAIRWAYDLKEWQIAGPSWMGAPGWRGRDLARYEIQARAKEGTPAPEMKLMLRRLLAERFKLVVHQETRDTTALVLTVDKPNPSLKRSADPNAPRRGEPGPDGLRFFNTTLAEFAEFLSGPLRAPVLDRTGLEGVFDFPLKNPEGNTPDEELARLAGSVREQLGLRLERQKTPVEMLVVDSGEKKPVEN
jgi:uncharacterized protein (TIGR03435 family)